MSSLWYISNTFVKHGPPRGMTVIIKVICQCIHISIRAYYLIQSLDDAWTRVYLICSVNIKVANILNRSVHVELPFFICDERIDVDDLIYPS